MGLLFEGGDVGLELLVFFFEGHDVVYGSFEEGDLAALLVGDGQGILELCIAVSELVASALLGLDALSAGGLLAGVGEVLDEGSGTHAGAGEVVVVGVLGVASAASAGACGGAGGGRGRVVAGRAVDEAVGPGGGGGVRGGRGGGRGLVQGGVCGGVGAGEGVEELRGGRRGRVVGVGVHVRMRKGGLVVDREVVVRERVGHPRVVRQLVLLLLLLVEPIRRCRRAVVHRVVHDAGQSQVPARPLPPLPMLDPHRLARLANALGVPVPVPSPSRAAPARNRFLLHVVPPPLLQDCPADHLRGILVPLHPSLHAQLAAIARAYALPSPVGLVLYLLDGPRLDDDIWSLLWSRVAAADPSPAPSPSALRPLTCSPSTPSTPSDSFRSVFKPPSDPATSPVLPLPGLTSPSLLPILAKVEFVIDKRKATWYSPWSNSRRKILPSAPLELLSVKRCQLLKNDPLGIHIEQDDDLDEDATATYHRPTDDSIASKEEQVLEMLEIMSTRSSSRSSHSSSPKQNSDSYLAYTEPLPRLLTNKDGVKREFAIFDDLELEFDHTFDDPNDRRKSQLIMSAKLDEIERTMAQLSPRILNSDLSERISPTSPNGLDFLSPIQSEDGSRSFTTSSPPRLADDQTGRSWPAIPFSIIKQGQPTEDPLPPPPRLTLNGGPPRAFISPPTRPPPPPPLSGGMSESEKRRRELEEEQGVFEVTIKQDLPPLKVNGGVIPLSPDPFSRYPSSPNEPSPEINAEVVETRARSGTVTTTKSRFSADSGEEPVSAGGLKPSSNRATLMSVRTIKKLWRRSKDKEKHLSSGGGDAPPPTPVTPTFGTPAGSNDIDKSLPSIPPPRPSRPSEDQLDFPDISMQAVMPPRMTPSPTPRGSSRPGVVGNDSNNGRRTPVGQDVVPTGRRTPQEQSPPSRPSLDHPPPPPLTSQQPSGNGRRTPQDQMVFPLPPSRPSLDQQPPPSHFRNPSQPQQPPMQMPMFQGRNPHNGPVVPLLASHYPSRSGSVSQQQKLDMNRLLFDQESPYPVRLVSANGGTGGAGAAIATSTAMAPTANYVAVAPPPPPQLTRPPSVEPEKSTAMTTMRKSILKWKLANSNPNPNTNGFSSTSSSSSASSSSSSNVGAVPRQSFERFERPGVAGSNGVYARGGGGGRRPSVINFGSTSSLSSSTSVSSNREIPRNPQVPAQYMGGEPKPPPPPPHVHFTHPNQHPQHHPPISTSPTTQTLPKPTTSLTLTLSNSKDLSPQSLSPSRQSLDQDQRAHSPGSVVERRSNASNASSFDMTQFEFVSPVLPASAVSTTHGSLRT